MKQILQSTQPDKKMQSNIQFSHDSALKYLSAIYNRANQGNKKAESQIQQLKIFAGFNANKTLSNSDFLLLEKKYIAALDNYFLTEEAPNEYIKSSFNYFKQTLKKERKVNNFNLPKDIKNFFDEMFGGRKIDTVFTETESIEKINKLLKEYEQQKKTKQIIQNYFVEKQIRNQKLDRMIGTIVWIFVIVFMIFLAIITNL